MNYESYERRIGEQGYHLDGDIYRDAKGYPKCYNGVFQELVERQKSGIPLSRREYEMYGMLLRTLVKIVLNNHKFKFREPELKDECALEAYCEVLPALPRYFNPEKGTAYAYAFRVVYTSMIHVLEANNVRNQLATNLIEKAEDDRVDTGHKVGPVYN